VRAGGAGGRRASGAWVRVLAPVLGALGALALLGAGGCERGAAPAGGETSASAPTPAQGRAAGSEAGATSVPVELGGERFHLELAADPNRRHRGLGGREHLPEGSGMLFAFADSAPRAFVMRDCRIPLDVAFLDGAGRVVAVHSMEVEPPQRPGESPGAYEARLPRYPSGAPVRFAIEVRGGRLAALGVAPGDRVAFDREAVLARTQ